MAARTYEISLRVLKTIIFNTIRTGQRSSHDMLAWLIIAFDTVAGTGTLAYFYYKLLNYFIRMKVEAEPDPEQLERETKLKRTFRVQEGEDSDFFLRLRPAVKTCSEKLITIT